MAVIDSLFPGFAAKRAEYRLKKLRTDAAIGILERKFDGAGGGRRNEGWRATGSDANAENGPALAVLRARARELRRNNPYAERAISGIADNVVGAGIVPRPITKNEKQAATITAKWAEWGETRACDADGIENFYGIQHKVIEAAAESGECLIRRRRRFVSDGLPVPLQIQVLEADFLDEAKSGTNGNNLIIQGVEFGPLGNRTAYWLFDEHPGASTGMRTMVSRRVPASDVAHIFLPKRAGQSRGYTWLAPVMQRLRNFDEMEDAVMEQAKIAACFAVFITKDDTGVNAASQPLIDRVEPGLIQELGIGQTATSTPPPTFNGYQAYSWQALHAIAVGLGIPYELMTGDMKGVNFSSGRMGWLHFARRVDVWQWRMMIPQLCEPIWEWFMEAHALTPGGANIEARAEWVPPRREMVDPKSEIETVKQRLRNGLATWPDALRELGITDPTAHAKEIQASNKLMDELGLILDFDPRHLTGAGINQMPQEPAAPEEETTDDSD